MEQFHYIVALKQGNVCGPYMVTIFNGTPMFEWYDSKVRSYEWTPKRHVSLIYFTISSFVHTILSLILNIIGGAYP